MRASLLASLALVHFAPLAPAQKSQLPPTPPRAATSFTLVSGPVSGTWAQAGSPYLVVGDLDVGALMIEAGVEVRTWPGVEFLISGSLVTQGSVSAPVVFTSKTPSSRWRGLRFDHASGDSALVHARVERAHAGGVQILSSRVELTGCELRDNVTSGSGGGLHADLTGELLVLSDCTIEGNEALVDGGGLWISGAGEVFLLDCVVSANAARPDLASLFAESRGGGLHVEDSVQLNLVDTLVAGNETWAACNGCNSTVAARGGGISLLNTSATLTRSIVRDNRATSIGLMFDGADSSGGGLYVASPATDVSVVVRNSILAGNRIWSDARVEFMLGAALHFDGQAADALLISNSTIARNLTVKGDAVPTSGGAWLVQAGIYTSASTSNAIVRSTVVRENSACQTFSYPTFSTDPTSCSYLWPGAPLAGGGLGVTYSNVEGGHAGIGNLDLPPLFAGAGTSYADLSIVPASPCVDAGDPALEFSDVSWPPSLGAPRGDMGHNGGPWAAGWLPQSGDGRPGT